MKKKIAIVLLASAIVLPALMIGGKAVRADENAADADQTELSPEEQEEVEIGAIQEDAVEENGQEEEAAEDTAAEETVSEEIVTESGDTETIEVETGETDRGSAVKKTAGIQVLIENTLQKDVTGIRVRSGQKKYSANLLQEKTVIRTAEAKETAAASENEAESVEATAAEPVQTDTAATSDEAEQILLASGQSLTVIVPEKYLNEEHMYDLELTYADGSTEELPYVMLVNKCTGKLHDDYGMALMEVQDPRLEAEDVDLTTEEIEQIEEETRETKAEILTAEIAEDAP